MPGTNNTSTCLVSTCQVRRYVEYLVFVYEYEYVHTQNLFIDSCWYDFRRVLVVGVCRLLDLRAVWCRVVIASLWYPPPSLGPLFPAQVQLVYVPGNTYVLKSIY